MSVLPVVHDPIREDKLRELQDLVRGARVPDDPTLKEFSTLARDVKRLLAQHKLLAGAETSNAKYQAAYDRAVDKAVDDPAAGLVKMKDVATKLAISFARRSDENRTAFEGSLSRKGTLANIRWEQEYKVRHPLSKQGVDRWARTPALESIPGVWGLLVRARTQLEEAEGFAVNGDFQSACGKLTDVNWTLSSFSDELARHEKRCRKVGKKVTPNPFDLHKQILAALGPHSFLPATTRDDHRTRLTALVEAGCAAGKRDLRAKLETLAADLQALLDEIEAAEGAATTAWKDLLDRYQALRADLLQRFFLAAPSDLAVTWRLREQRFVEARDVRDRDAASAALDVLETARNDQAVRQHAAAYGYWVDRGLRETTECLTMYRELLGDGAGAYLALPQCEVDGTTAMDVMQTLTDTLGHAGTDRVTYLEARTRLEGAVALHARFRAHRQTWEAQALARAAYVRDFEVKVEATREALATAWAGIAALVQGEDRDGRLAALEHRWDAPNRLQAIRARFHRGVNEATDAMALKGVFDTERAALDQLETDLGALDPDTTYDGLRDEVDWSRQCSRALTLIGTATVLLEDLGQLTDPDDAMQGFIDTAEQWFDVLTLVSTPTGARRECESLQEMSSELDNCEETLGRIRDALQSGGYTLWQSDDELSQVEVLREALLKRAAALDARIVELEALRKKTRAGMLDTSANKSQLKDWLAGRRDTLALVVQALTGATGREVLERETVSLDNLERDLVEIVPKIRKLEPPPDMTVQTGLSNLKKRLAASTPVKRFRAAAKAQLEEEIDATLGSLRKTPYYLVRDAVPALYDKVVDLEEKADQDGQDKEAYDAQRKLWKAYGKDARHKAIEARYPAVIAEFATKRDAIHATSKREGRIGEALAELVALHAEVDALLQRWEDAKGKRKDRKALRAELQEQQDAAELEAARQERLQAEYTGMRSILVRWRDAMAVRARGNPALEAANAYLQQAAAAAKSERWDSAIEILGFVRERLELVRTTGGGMDEVGRRALATLKTDWHRVSGAYHLALDDLGRAAGDVNTPPAILDELSKEIARLKAGVPMHAFDDALDVVTQDDAEQAKRLKAREAAYAVVRDTRAFLFDDRGVRLLADAPFPVDVPLERLATLLVDLERNLLMAVKVG